MNSRWQISWMFLAAMSPLGTWAQVAPGDPSSYSIPTPRPISPAEGTTTPSAQATQRQNPYLGSEPSARTGSTLQLSLRDAMARGLQFNLGLVESVQGSADVRAERRRALSALLPQIKADGRQAYEDLSYKEIGLKLPAIPGLRPLPPTSGGFGYQDARISLSQSLFNQELRQRYQAGKFEEQASALSIQDSRDVVALAVGSAYFQVVASAARVETVKAQLTTAREFDQLTAHRVGSEVSPEIDSLRAQVERQSAEQRLTNVINQLEKDKLTFARITGLAIDQEFELTDKPARAPVLEFTLQSATDAALGRRSDLASAEAAVRAAESALKAAKAQRLPVISLSADYGTGGTNLANANQVYSIGGNISVPLYTGGRIAADIAQSQADLDRRRAEYADLKGRIAYDVKVAWLDVNASNSSVRVAESNRALASRALEQSQDRYTNGVTNYLEVVQAEQAVAAANENTIESLFSLNVSLIALARAMGGAESRLTQLLGEK